MKDLLTNIIDAHGGIDRWNSFQKVEATIVSGGAFWGMKGLVQDANPRRMTVSLHEEFASVTPFGAAAAHQLHAGSHRHRKARRHGGG